MTNTLKSFKSCFFFIISDIHKCYNEESTPAERVSSVREEWLVPVKQEGMKENDVMHSDICEEYHVTLEKIWGILGLQIEVCISESSFLHSII